jgi:glucose-1-phosphate thymidylyltransferase
VVEFAQSLQPSEAGVEITDLNCLYMERGDLRVEVLGVALPGWMQVPTNLCSRQPVLSRRSRNGEGMMISCREIAFRMGYIEKNRNAQPGLQINNQYGSYLLDLLKDSSVLLAP